METEIFPIIVKTQEAIPKLLLAKITYKKYDQRGRWIRGYDYFSTYNSSLINQVSDNIFRVSNSVIHLKHDMAQN